MNTHKYILKFVILLCISGSFEFTRCGIDTSAYRYFPTTVGNYYVYHYTKTGFPDQYFTVRITGTEIFNNKRYYQFVGTPLTGYFRYDSLSGNIYRYDTGWPNLECKADSLWASVNNNVISCVFATSKCYTDGNTIVLFGNYTTQEKSYGGYVPHWGWSRKYAKNIGFYYTYEQQYYTEWIYNLAGCVINGIVYGDTNTYVGIKNLSSDFPDNFSLSQNYPNPFNPVTIIKFAIPPVRQRHAFDVRLIIYDILGREIAILVNEQLQPGTYEVEWDGSNYPSGMYFYKLITSDYTETKKMVLLK